ncbi:MAG: DUF3244 domain-containing protein [Bacteroidaceae bacterium]|nr:DUF3244 domain-containing protein [Bacteroidaceae bacterium]
MKKFILIFVVLFGCGILGVEAKKKVVLTPAPGTVSRPTDLSGNPSPTLSAEYDADTLSIAISDYWGDAEVFILSSPLHQLVDSAEETVVFETQFDFSLTGYVEGATYQVIIMLGNGEVYMGEFEL